LRASCRTRDRPAEAPAERFDEDDLRLFLDAGRKALNGTPRRQREVGEPDQRKPRRSRGGHAVHLEGHACRQLRVYSESGGHKGTTSPNLCKVDGKWRAVSTAELKR
jgi:hypothetical protein